MAGKTHHDQLAAEVNEALIDGLDAEYSHAVTRAQALLASVDQQRVPTTLYLETRLSGVLPDELAEAVDEWHQHHVTLIERLRELTAMCATHLTDVDLASRENYVTWVQDAEAGLAFFLEKRFQI